MIKCNKIEQEEKDCIIALLQDYNGSWDATNWFNNKEVLVVGAGNSVKRYKELRLLVTANIEKTKPAAFQDCEATLPPIDRSKIPPSVPLDSLKGFC